MIHCDVRTLPPQTPQSVVDDVQRAIAPLRAADPELDVSVEVAYEAPYSFIPIDSPIMQEVQKACIEVTGKAMAVLASPATSDSRWLVLYAKIPTCKFSFTTVGSGTNERLRVDGYYDMIRVYTTVALNTLYRLARLRGNRASYVEANAAQADRIHRACFFGTKNKPTGNIAQTDYLVNTSARRDPRRRRSPARDASEPNTSAGDESSGPPATLISELEKRWQQTRRRSSSQKQARLNTTGARYGRTITKRR